MRRKAVSVLYSIDPINRKRHEAGEIISNSQFVPPGVRQKKLADPTDKIRRSNFSTNSSSLTRENIKTA